jgi:hypothetical protein
MSTVILFQYLYHDREGTVPMNTFTVPDAAHKPYPTKRSDGFYDDVSGHLGDILQKLFVETFPFNFFWVDGKENFDPDEQEGYGFVYSELVKDEGLLLSTDAYKAAYTLAEYILNDEDFQDILSPRENKTRSRLILRDLTPTGLTLEDISFEAPALPVAPTNDSRFTIGEQVVIGGSSRRAGVYTYAGINFNVRDASASNTYTLNQDDKTVLVGVNSKSVITKAAMDEFLTSEEVEVHPLPTFMTKDWHDGVEKPKWFARSKAHKNMEGFGKTKGDAKLQFATKVLTK